MENPFLQRVFVMIILFFCLYAAVMAEPDRSRKCKSAFRVRLDAERPAFLADGQGYGTVFRAQIRADGGRAACAGILPEQRIRGWDVDKRRKRACLPVKLHEAHARGVQMRAPDRREGLRRFAEWYKEYYKI